MSSNNLTTLDIHGVTAITVGEPYLHDGTFATRRIVVHGQDGFDINIVCFSHKTRDLSVIFVGPKVTDHVVGEE